MSMKDFGKMAYDKVKDSIGTTMVIITKDFGVEIRNKEKEY